LSNARSYTQQGSIDLDIRRGNEEPGVITGKDTGTGMAAENIERVFEEFQESGERCYSGTGLGLAITNTLTELHGDE